jgi:hypothetical protein
MTEKESRKAFAMAKIEEAENTLELIDLKQDCREQIHEKLDEFRLEFCRIIDNLYE